MNALKKNNLSSFAFCDGHFHLALLKQKQNSYASELNVAGENVGMH